MSIDIGKANPKDHLQDATKNVAVLCFDENALWYGLGAELGLRLAIEGHDVVLRAYPALSHRAILKMLGQVTAKDVVNAILDRATTTAPSRRIGLALQRYPEVGTKLRYQVSLQSTGTEFSDKNGLVGIDEGHVDSKSFKRLCQRGYANPHVVGSLATWARSGFPHEDLTPRVFAEAQMLYEAVYEAVRHDLEQMRPQIVAVPNGRFIQEGAALEAARDLGMKVWCFETFTTFSQRILAVEGTLHEPQTYACAVNRCWTEKREDDDVAEAAVAAWFARRTIPSEVNPFAQTGCAEKWLNDSDQRKLAVFATTSADEILMSMGDASPSGQFEAIRNFVEAIQDLENWVGVIRVHPNMRNKLQCDQQRLRGFLDQFDIRVVSSTDPTSTYELVDAADLVVTYGSSVGVEAAFMRKPTLCPITTPDTVLGAVHRNRISASTIQEASEVKSEALDQAYEAAVRSGYFQQFGGDAMKFFRNEAGVRTLNGVWIDRWSWLHGVRARSRNR